MDYKKVLKEKNIALLWLPKDYSEQGTHIAPCYQFPNGAICLRLGMTETKDSHTAFHEIGHLEEGKPLTKTDPRIRKLEHYKNEANANKFLLQNEAPKFVEANEYNPIWATPDRLCAYLGLRNTFENIWLAQQEIDTALWDAL